MAEFKNQVIYREPIPTMWEVIRYFPGMVTGFPIIIKRGFIQENIKTNTSEENHENKTTSENTTHSKDGGVQPLGQENNQEISSEQEQRPDGQIPAQEVEVASIQEPLQFYDLKAKERFITDNYEIVEKNNRRMAQTVSPNGTKCCRMMKKEVR